MSLENLDRKVGLGNLDPQVPREQTGSRDPRVKRE